MAGALLLPACFSSATTTAGGKGFPEPSVSMAPTVAPGSSQTATVTVRNPGPGAMNSVLITFSRLGRAPDRPVVPNPIVDIGFKGHNPAVVSVDPKPAAVSQDGLVYRFGGLKVGGTLVVHFHLRMPADTGLAANAVIVADGSDLERSRGIALETQVSG